MGDDVTWPPEKWTEVQAQVLPELLPPDPLDPDQRARAAALRVAREVLLRRNVVGTVAPDAVDLVNVAAWIVTGADPWSELKAAEIEPS